MRSSTQIAIPVLITVFMVAISAGCFYSFRKTNTLNLPLFQKKLVRYMGACSGHPPCPCPPPTIVCDLLYVFSNDRAGLVKVSSRFSKDLSNRSITVSWNINLGITQTESRSLPAQPDTLMFGDNYPNELIQFYWNSVNKAEFSNLKQEQNISYEMSLQELGIFKVEVHIGIEPPKKSLLYSVTVTPLSQ